MKKIILPLLVLGFFASSNVFSHTVSYYSKRYDDIQKLKENSFSQVSHKMRSLKDLFNAASPASDRAYNAKEKYNNKYLKNLKPFNFDTIKKPKKIGRNEPCPCGSGKKYKKCCGKISI